MKPVFLFVIFLIGISIQTFGQFTETMNPNGVTKNLETDFGMSPNLPDSNQSLVLQNAIRQLSEQGGGNLVLPKGEYYFSQIQMYSNIHLLIEAGTIIRPVWPENTKVAVFNFGVDRDTWKKNPKTYIENVSVRGVGGRFIVDYSNRIRKNGEGCRAIVFSMVKNFLVENMDVSDNFTTYCGMTLSPVKEHNDFTLGQVKTWEVSRATKGTIRNCRHFNASPGYGLVQLHGAQSVYFENLYSLGGVALRLESGANTENIGVYDIHGKNIFCENGRAAIMLGPHSAKNGRVVVDSVVTKSCAYAVTIGMGGVKEGAPDQTPGYFSDSSKITNIHVIFGKTAQIKNQSILSVPVEYYDDLKLWPDNKFLTGPSIGAVSDNSVTYHVSVENITMEGFKYNTDKKILTEADVRPGNKWDEWDLWKTKFLDDEHRTQNGAVIVPFDIPDSTLPDQKIVFVDSGPKVGLNEVQSKKTFKVFPNPASHIIYASHKHLNSNLLLELYNTAGTQLKSFQVVNSNPTAINISFLNNGIYYLKLIDNKSKQTLGVNKIMKIS